MHQLKITRDEQGNITLIVMPRPSNFHDHLRFANLMRAVAKPSMSWVKYLLVMPNVPMIRTIEDALEYYRTLKMLAREHGFKVRFVMTLYHTKDVTPAVIERMAKLRIKMAIKDYPNVHGATTGSGLGVDFRDNMDTLYAMEECKVPLLVHFEDPLDKYNVVIDPPLREAHAIEHRAKWLRDTFPNLRLCAEHASTKEMVEFVQSDTSGNTVMTATPQHMDIDCTAENFAKPWGATLKCMPIVKSPEHCVAVADFATSGDFRCILGNDGAGHPSKTKQLAFDQCSNGCYTPHALPMYVKVFLRMKRLDHRFINFACLNGPKWWGLPLPEPDDTIMVRRELAQDIPDPTQIPGEDDVVWPLGWSPEPKNRLKIGFALA